MPSLGCGPSLLPHAQGHHTEPRGDAVTLQKELKWSVAVGGFAKQAVHVGGEPVLGVPLVGGTNRYTGVLITALSGLSCRPATELLWSSLHQAATELEATTGNGTQRQARGGLPRLPLIRGTCRQSAPPSSLPSVKPPPLPERTHTLSCCCNYCNCFT